MLPTKLLKQVFFLFLAVAVCGGIAFAQTQAPDISNHLELVNDRLDVDGSSAKAIAGTVNNLNTKSCDVVVRLNTYGPTHTFLANRVIRRAALEPGGTWNFRIRVAPKVEQYEVISVKARWY
jgi:hypothetical protein